jgi:hypothetical protein
VVNFSTSTSDFSGSGSLWKRFAGLRSWGTLNQRHHRSGGPIAGRRRARQLLFRLRRCGAQHTRIRGLFRRRASSATISGHRQCAHSPWRHQVRRSQQTATIYTLNINSSSSATVDLGGRKRTLAGGGLLLGSGNTSVFSSERWNAHLRNGRRHLLRRERPALMVVQTVTFSIGAGITDNAGALRLIVSSSEASWVPTRSRSAGPNSYTGGTVVSQGSLVRGGTGRPWGRAALCSTTAPSPRTLGGTLASQAVTLNGGAILTLAGTNTLTNLFFNNSGGTAPWPTSECSR